MPLTISFSYFSSHSKFDDDSFDFNFFLLKIMFYGCLILYLPLVDLFFFFIVAQLHACVVCIALPASLAVVPTQGFYFAFVIFSLLLFLENNMLWLGGGSKG